MNIVTPGITMEITYTGIDARSIGLPEVVVVVGQRYVVEPLDEVKTSPTRKFQVGDFVKVIRDDHLASIIGKLGKVVVVTGGSYEGIGVEFLEFDEDRLHDLMGACSQGHGRWFGDDHESTLELVD